MKRCPECRRNYYDDSLLYCLEDGTVLVQGLVPSPDEPQTAILSTTGTPGEAATRAQFHTTEQTAILPGGVAEPRKARAFDKRLLLAPLALAAIVGGLFGYRYLNAGAEQINSIAVLPFQNAGGNPDTEYLSDGLPETLIFRLSQLPGLKVSPLSSVIRYKGSSANVSDVARELEVDAVMMGRLVQRGEILSVSVELVDARTKKLLWGEQYDRKLSELLNTQREIATTIAQKLQLRLSGEGEQKLARKYTDSNEAYQLYMRGRFHASKRTKDDLLRAVDLYRQAVELDPQFALAYVGMAQAYNLMPTNFVISPRESFPQAKAAAERALAIDPAMAEGYGALATTLALFDWNWAESERTFKRAIELDPEVAENHYFHGLWYLTSVGRTEEAVNSVKRALEIEPASAAMNANLAILYVYNGQRELALQQARVGHSLDPSNPQAVSNLGNVYIETGMHPEAIALAEEWMATSPADPRYITLAANAYAAAGRRDKVEKLVAMLDEIGKTRYVPRFVVGTAWARLGDKEKALAELETALRERETLATRLKIHPALAGLRGDTRFQALVKQMYLAQ